MLIIQLDGLVGDVGEAVDETLSRLSRVRVSPGSSDVGLDGGVGLRRNCRRMAPGAAWLASRCRKA